MAQITKSPSHDVDCPVSSMSTSTSIDTVINKRQEPIHKPLTKSQQSTRLPRRKSLFDLFGKGEKAQEETKKAEPWYAHLFSRAMRSESKPGNARASKTLDSLRTPTKSRRSLFGTVRRRKALSEEIPRTPAANSSISVDPPKDARKRFEDGSLTISSPILHSSPRTIPLKMPDVVPSKACEAEIIDENSNKNPLLVRLEADNEIEESACPVRDRSEALSEPLERVMSPIPGIVFPLQDNNSGIVPSKDENKEMYESHGLEVCRVLAAGLVIGIDNSSNEQDKAVSATTEDLRRVNHRSNWSGDTYVCEPYEMQHHRNNESRSSDGFTGDVTRDDTNSNLKKAISMSFRHETEPSSSSLGLHLAPIAVSSNMNLNLVPDKSGHESVEVANSAPLSENDTFKEAIPELQNRRILHSHSLPSCTSSLWKPASSPRHSLDIPIVEQEKEKDEVETRFEMTNIGVQAVKWTRASPRWTQGWYNAGASTAALSQWTEASNDSETSASRGFRIWRRPESLTSTLSEATTDLDQDRGWGGFFHIARPQQPQRLTDSSIE